MKLKSIHMPVAIMAIAMMASPIFVSAKTDNNPNDNDIKVVGVGSVKKDSCDITKIIVGAPGDDSLYSIDGQEVPANSDILSKLDPNDIESISVFKTTPAKIIIITKSKKYKTSSSPKQ